MYFPLHRPSAHLPSSRTCQLSDFELLGDVPFDAGEEDFALSRFEPVDGRWQRPLVVRVGELNEFLVDELGKGDLSGAFAVKKHLAQSHLLSPRPFLVTQS